jgi:hypothetical protein
MIKIIPVDTKQKLAAFVDFPHELYKDDINYVPELFIAQRDLLTPSHHPFHKHASVQLFLAYENEKIAGRIAGILNNRHNEFNNSNDGFFGFFDCNNSAAVAEGLMDAVYKWLKKYKVQTIIGPVNFSTNETCGVLIHGYDDPPVAMMTYNKPYYAALLEQLGFKKKTDLFAYQIIASNYKDKPLQMLDVLTQRLAQKGIIIRKINLKNFKQEVASLLEVYNNAWDKNLGFVPMTKEEFEYLAKDLKMILDPDFCVVAEQNGKVVGFSLSIPDINEVLIKIKRGRLLPTGIIKLLTQRKKIKSIRVIALGVLEGYRKMGIEAVFYGDVIRKCLEKKIDTAEASWILEDNLLMNRAIQNINGKIYKTYRIYDKQL